jgi:heme/copper-type cytochrome/quinol oxidase subunit 2
MEPVIAFVGSVAGLVVAAFGVVIAIGVYFLVRARRKLRETT